MDRLTAISLFSGCGGADIGAKRAGTDIILAIDNNKNAVATYRKYSHLLTVPGAEVKEANLRDIVGFPSCDLILGCYPCQTFSMGGPRSPQGDPRTNLFVQFRRCLANSDAKYFITENVPGLAWLNEGKYLKMQLKAFQKVGRGYNLSLDLLNMEEYGVPQARKRLFIVGVRRDIGLHYWFPSVTHGSPGSGLMPLVSHGEGIADIPIAADNEYYDYPKEPFSWWYMSRNRKRKWEEPSFTIQANSRHVPLHPASPTMRMVESNLKDGFKQRWVFTGEHDHLDGHPERPLLELPRRLSWRECAAIQTFPSGFEPVGGIASKYEQVGNATPPLLMEILIRRLTDGTGLKQELYFPSHKTLRLLNS